MTDNWTQEYKFKNPEFWKKDARLSSFANNLKCTSWERIEASEDLLLLKLNHLFLNDEEDVGRISALTGSQKVFNWIFLRPDVKTIWDAVFHRLTSTDSDNPQFGGTAFFRVTGNSGIGKSYTMIYLLKKFLDAGRFVFYDDRKKKQVYAFIPRKKSKSTTQDDAAQANDGGVEYDVYITFVENFKGIPIALFSSTYPGSTLPPVLWDPSENSVDNFVPSYLPNARTALAISIKENLVNNAYKDYNVGTWYMPQYSLCTLERIRTLAYPKFDADVLRYRYYRYGGLFRLAFAVKEALEEFDEKATNSINTLGMDQLESILRGSVGSHYKIVSSGVFKIIPSEDFRSREIDFGSPYMYALLAGKFWKELALKGKSSNKQYTSWFEAMAIHKLAVGGTFLVRKLDTGKQHPWEELELSQVPIRIIPKDGDTSANDRFYEEWGKLTSRSVMLDPEFTNLPVVDCADKSGRGYQVTAAAACHSIAYDECGKILEKMDRLSLYFVVTDQNAEDFPKQSFKGVGVGKKNMHAAKVDQYVLKLDIDHLEDLIGLYKEKETKMNELFQNVEVIESIRKRRRRN